MFTKVEIKKEYIFVKFSGRIILENEKDLDEAKNALVDTLNIAREKNIFKLLFDCCNVSGTLSTMNRFFIAELLAKENLKQFNGHTSPLKMAIALNRSLIDTGKFGETVGRNRGLNVLVADNVQEAFKWLGREP